MNISVSHKWIKPKTTLRFCFYIAEMDWMIVLYGCIFAHITDVTAIDGLVCPVYCRCYKDKSSSLETVQCVGKHITSIPTGIPDTTQVLYIEDVGISAIRNKSFHKLQFLVKLLLL